MENEKIGARNSRTDQERLQQIHDFAVENGAVCKTKSIPENALKAISETDDELRVGNYIVLFGGRDLTGIVQQKNKDGSSGEYFSEKTVLDSEYTKTGRLYVDFEHGKDPDGMGIGKDDVLGHVDWSTAKTDERGVFVQRVLNRRTKYVKWLEPLIKEGLIGNSSEAVPGGVEKSDNGEITRWPLRRDTLTVNPMEPRMLSKNAVQALKALSDVLPLDPSALPAVEDKENEKSTKPIGVITMTEQTAVDVQAEIKKALDLRDAQAKVEAEKAAALKDAEEAGYKKAVEEMKSRRAPAYNTAPLGFKDDPSLGFKHWLVTGQPNEALIEPDGAWSKAIEDNARSIRDGAGKAAFNVTTGPSGAYLVPDPLYNGIIAKRDIASWVRQVPVQKFETSADHILVPIEDTAHTDFVITAEAGSYDEDEGTVAQKDIILYKFTKLTKMSEEFVSYQSAGFDSWLTQRLGDAVAGTENNYFTNGTGSSQPEGAAYSATTSSVTAASATVILPSELATFVGKLGGGYNVPSQCAFLMKNQTKWSMKGYMGSSFAGFAYIGTPAGGDFLGYKAAVSDDMPAMTTGLKPVLFGNFNYFGVAERPGMMMQRNPYLYMATGQIGLFSSIYRGSAVLQAEAIYYITMG